MCSDVILNFRSPSDFRAGPNLGAKCGVLPVRVCHVKAEFGRGMAAVLRQQVRPRRSGSDTDRGANHGRQCVDRG